MNGEKLVQNIKAIAVAKGIKMEYLYTVGKVTSGALSQWKSGETKPRVATLSRIADTLGVSMSDLMEGTDSIKETPASTEASGVEVNPRYYELSDSERAAVDALIDHYATTHQSGG